MSTRKEARLKPFEGGFPKECQGCKRIFYTPCLTAQWCQNSCRNKTRSATLAGRATRIAYNVRLRKLVLEHYGGKCACCGETYYEFLAMDHIEGGGSIHHKELRKLGISICNWLKKNNFPEGFRVLCHNCNSAKGFYGYCPHEKENNG